MRQEYLIVRVTEHGPRSSIQKEEPSQKGGVVFPTGNRAESE
jgi:hypothetical protein